MTSCRQRNALNCRRKRDTATDSSTLNTIIRRDGIAGESISPQPPASLLRLIGGPEFVLAALHFINRSTNTESSSQFEGHDMAEVIDAATEELVESIRNLVLSLAIVLVDDGVSVSVKATPHDDGTTLMLTVAPRDLGRVIGKQGQTARSLRVLLGAASMKSQHRFKLDISATTSSLPNETA